VRRSDVLLERSQRPHGQARRRFRLLPGGRRWRRFR
jgi:hypothetical protein